MAPNDVSCAYAGATNKRAKAQPGRTGTRQTLPNRKKLFVFGFYESPGLKIERLESGRFGKSGYRAKAFVFPAKEATYQANLAFLKT
jgi:hypothetical protein